MFTYKETLCPIRSHSEEIIDKSGLNFGPNVFCAAVGRTMYEQFLPDKSTDLIFSAIAAMILSKSPCKLQDGLYPSEANSQEIDTFRTQAALDWKTFLVMRGRELRQGGYLVVLSLGATKMLSVFGEEFMDCNLSYALYRNEEDHAFPFKGNDKDLEEMGLELVSTRSFVNKLDHPSFHVSSKDDATKKVYADRIVAGIKPWLYGHIYNGLSCSRSRQERQNLVEIYFSRLWDFAYQNNDQIPQMGLIEVVARKRE